MKYQVTHTTRYKYDTAVSVCHNQAMLSPRVTPRQECLQHRISITPSPSSSDRRHDYFGNDVAYFSFNEGFRQLVVESVSLVAVSDELPITDGDSPAWDEIAPCVRRSTAPESLDALQFLFDSPRVKTSRALHEYGAPSFPAGRPLLEGVRDLNQRIHSDFKFDPKATTTNTPIDEVLKKRRGVCQDFAHLATGVLRSVGLPARYVSGYLRTYPPEGKERLVGSDASHAWTSVYGGALGWIDFDPTNNAFPSNEHITVGWGRDYDDVCPVRGVQIGGSGHRLSVSVDVAPLDESN